MLYLVCLPQQFDLIFVGLDAGCVLTRTSQNLRVCDQYTEQYTYRGTCKEN